MNAMIGLGRETIQQMDAFAGLLLPAMATLTAATGGVTGAAVRQGVRAIWALSLPGKVAPVTSGKIIRDTIYNIWNELGV